MCCPGCRAVSQLIHDSGMDRFYRQRSAHNLRPEAPDPEATSRYRIYDDPEIAGTFCTASPEGKREANLLLGGLTCAACTWLVEHSLKRQAGVDDAVVNLAQHRLRIRFDAEQVALSELFQRIEALGYTARPFTGDQRREQALRERRSALRALGVAGVGMMQVGMFAIALHAGDLQGMEPQYQRLLRWVALLVCSAVVFYSARSFFTTAWRHLRHGALVMDLPVSIAIGLAYSASVWATVSGTGQVYFDSVVMFTFFLLLGRFIEQRLRQRSVWDWSDAEEALPAVVRRWDDGSWSSVARQQLRQGDRILVPQGEIIPVDSTVVSGQSSADESAFNGEHLPRPLIKGDPAFAGTLNLESALELEVLAEYRDSRLAALQRSVELAHEEKPALARLADRLSGYFVAGVLVTTSITALYWWQVEPARTLWVCLSVLVVACPCALALATPAALSGAATALRRAGILVHGENALETLPRVTHLVFDKTGTLTQGAFSLEHVAPLSNLEPDQFLPLCAALQAWSSHPVAQAFGHITPDSDVWEVEYLPGLGLSGRWQHEPVRLGSAAFCREIAPTLPDAPDQPLYWIALVSAGRPLAWLGLHDAPRPDSAAIVAAARSQGLEVALLSGDSSSQGPSIANVLGIDRALFGLGPTRKQAQVAQWQQAGAVVAMVGDGLNDAPVLAAANVSFAVANATDLARAQADLVITEHRLDRVLYAFTVARHCRDILKQNLLWALGYNVAAIPLAAAGWIPPWAAAIGMSASSLVVVANSLRLNRRAVD